MDTTASFVRGATPTITVTVDHDLTGLRCYVGVRGVGAYVEREVEPTATEGGCTLSVTLTQAESLGFFPGSVTVEVKAYDASTGSVIASGHATIGVESTIIGHTLPE